MNIKIDFENSLLLIFKFFILSFIFAFVVNSQDVLVFIDDSTVIGVLSVTVLSGLVLAHLRIKRNKQIIKDHLIGFDTKPIKLFIEFFTLCVLLAYFVSILIDHVGILYLRDYLNWGIISLISFSLALLVLWIHYYKGKPYAFPIILSISLISTFSIPYLYMYNLNLLYINIYSVLIIAVISVLFLVTIMGNDIGSNSMKKSPSNFDWKDERIFLLIIILMAFSLRVWNIGHLSIWADEGQVFTTSRNILATGYPILDSGYYYTRDLPHLYLVALFFEILGENETAIRLPSVIAGTLLVIPVYYIVKKSTNWLFALFAASLIAFHPWIVEYSRIGRSYILMVLFLSISIYYYVRIGDRNDVSLKPYLLFGVFAALASLTHQLGQTSAFLIIPILLIFIFSDWEIEKTDLKGIVSASLLIGGSTIFYHLLSSFAYYNINQSAQENGGSLTIIDTISSLLPIGPNFNIEHIIFLVNPSPLLTCTAFITLFGTVVAWDRVQSSHKMLAIIFITFLFVIGFSNRTIDFNRAVLFTFPIIVSLSSIGLYLVVSHTYGNVNIRHTVIIFLLITSLIAIGSGPPINENQNIMVAEHGDPINPHHSLFEGFTHRHDHKTTYEYVNQMADSNSEVIVFGNPKFYPIYLDNAYKVPYYVWTGTSPDIDGKHPFVENSTRIADVNELESVLQEREKVWIVTTYSLSDHPQLGHINDEFRQYIEDHDPVYQSSDPYARVYRLEKGVDY